MLLLKRSQSTIVKGEIGNVREALLYEQFVILLVVMECM